jgi:ABC-type multidrug transport system fused ATPase/permease subunit
MVTLVVIAGVIGLLAVLMMTALAFSAVRLSDRSQALGLPEGSVRAVIALSLIVIFVITVVFLFGNLGTQLNQIQHLTLAQTNAIPGNLVANKRSEEEPKKKEAADLQKKADDLKAKGSSDAAKAQEEATAAANEADAAKGLYTVDRYVEPSRGSDDLAKQVITTISTLVVSISAFYFGSSTAISAAKKAETPPPPSSAPAITKQPTDVSVSAGEAAEFSVVATGPNLSYQWQEVTESGGTPIPGATNNTYRLPAVKASDTGRKFSCKITNPGGTVTSTVAQLTVA